MRASGGWAAALLAGALWSMAWIPGASGTPLPLLALWAVAFAAYGFAVSRAAAMSDRTVWLGGIILRAGLLPAVPTLSEDIYRYMWDGWVQLHGVNPFAYPPSAPELAPLRLDWWSFINHSTVPTIYPPGAQIIFLGLAAIATGLAVVVPGWLVFKAAWAAADLQAARLLAGLVEDGAHRRRVLVLYLWSPLLLVEVAWSGHLEPLGLAAMLGALALARRYAPTLGVQGGGGRGRHRAMYAGAALGVGGSIKFAPLAAVPALWRRYGVSAAALAILVPALLYLPYAGAGVRLFEGLRTYAEAWAFNAGLFGLLERVSGGGDAARLIAAAVVVAVASRAALRRWDLGRALYWTIGAALLLSPTIHPWYLLWILPLACLRVGRGWLLYTGTVGLAYAGRDAYLATGAWPEPVWSRVLIHAPPLVLLVWDGMRGTGPKSASGPDEDVAGRADEVRGDDPPPP